MLLLRENKNYLKEESDLPKDFLKKVSYRELILLNEQQSLNKGNTLFSYKSSKESMKIVATPLKGNIEYTSSGIDIDIPPRMAFFIPVVGMKQIDYCEKHFINGGRPLTTMIVTILLKDGGILKYSYQLVGDWPKNYKIRQKILGAD